MVECTAFFLTVFTGQYLGVLVLSRSYSPLSEPVFHGNCHNQINMARRATDVHRMDMRHSIAQHYRAFTFFFLKVASKIAKNSKDTLYLETHLAFRVGD